MNLLVNYLDKLNIPYNDETIEKFETYYNLLIEWNKKFNLTAITEKNEVITKHFADSLYGYDYIKNAKSVADVGAGAGFPSIPLAIVCQDIEFTLIDSLNKRVTFLNEVANTLNLKNVTAVHSRVEDFCQKNRNQFDIATARAVASLPTLLEYLVPLLKKGGKAVCYKSINIDNEIELSKNSLSKLDAKIIDRYDYDIDGNIRNILIVQSIKECNKCYPRSGNKPKDKPL